MAAPDVVEEAMASIVSVAATRTADGLPALAGLGAPDDLEIHADGSGVVVAASGLVVTSAHIVDGDARLRITLPDGRERDATVLGVDADSDLAVVQVANPPAGLRPLRFANSSRVRPGETIFVLGNPYGLGPSVSEGVVSAIGRTDLGIALYESFIQTDAAMNPGNSGGAMIDHTGALVGIATANLSPSGGDDGVGWAIPANYVRPILDALVQHGTVERAWLGVEVQAVAGELAAALGVRDVRGVVVTKVVGSSPAERAGIRRGDVIVQIDDAPTHGPGALRNAIAALPVSRTVAIHALRAAAPRVFYVELSARPGADRDAPAQPRVAPERSVGLTMVRHASAGVRVRGVAPRSRAAEAGLRKGDLILAIGPDQQQVARPDQVSAALRSAAGSIALLIQREGEYSYVSVPQR